MCVEVCSRRCGAIPLSGDRRVPLKRAAAAAVSRVNCLGVEVGSRSILADSAPAMGDEEEKVVTWEDNELRQQVCSSQRNRLAAGAKPFCGKKPLTPHVIAVD